MCRVLPVEAEATWTPPGLPAMKRRDPGEVQLSGRTRAVRPCILGDALVKMRLPLRQESSDYPRAARPRRAATWAMKTRQAEQFPSLGARNGHDGVRQSDSTRPDGGGPSELRSAGRSRTRVRFYRRPQQQFLLARRK